MENAALCISQIPAIGKYPPGRYFPLRITVTKGSRPRTIWVPSFVIDETWHYINLERRRIVLTAKKRNPNFRMTDKLWLNRWGNDLTDEGIRERFDKALREASIGAGTFHSTRHTFAITMLDRLLKRLTDPEQAEKRSLLILKRLLGHKRLSSTERYLDAWKLNLGDIFIDDLEAPDEVGTAA